MLRLESGAEFIFKGLRGILNVALLRLEMRGNTVDGSAAGALVAVFAGGEIGSPSVARPVSVASSYPLVRARNKVNFGLPDRVRTWRMQEAIGHDRATEQNLVTERPFRRKSR